VSCLAPVVQLVKCLKVKIIMINADILNCLKISCLMNNSFKPSKLRKTVARIRMKQVGSNTKTLKDKGRFINRI